MSPTKTGRPSVRDLPERQMSENELSDLVAETGHLFGWIFAHFRPARTKYGWTTPVALDGKGFPDLVCVRERIIYAELKKWNGELSPEQELWRDRTLAAGGEWYLWRPQDWLDGSIEEVLRRRVTA